MRTLFWLLLPLTLLTMATAAPAAGRYDGDTDEQRVGRYTVLGLGPTSQQQHPLQSLTNGKAFRRGVTVGDAMRQVLVPTGYSLASARAAGAAMEKLIAQPLPAIHRSLSVMPVTSALETLAGEGYQLVVDPINRLVAFEPAPRYRALAGS